VIDHEEAEEPVGGLPFQVRLPFSQSDWPTGRRLLTASMVKYWTA